MICWHLARSKAVKRKMDILAAPQKVKTKRLDCPLLAGSGTGFKCQKREQPINSNYTLNLFFPKDNFSNFRMYFSCILICNLML